MRILIVHNYTQRRGGSDESAEHELQLLRERGHVVRFYFRHNDEIKSFSLLRKGLLFFEPLWSRKSYREVKQILRDFQPEIVHFHSFFPLVSPSTYYACAESRVPVVQTLHDYRLLCPIGSFFRDGAICKECFHHSLLRGIRYGCYHDSHIQTASIALMLRAHRLLKTWSQKVTAFIAVSEFSRHKFIESGIAESKIFMRPNFLAQDPELGKATRKYVLFVGRLSPEKGLDTLLRAWHSLPDVPLKIIGDGDLRPAIERYIRQNGLTQIEVIGFIPLKDVLTYLKEALLLVMPSVNYETFGLTIIEAYATGTPVVASRLGAINELITDGLTGLSFNPGDAGDLVAKVQYALNHAVELAQWGKQARMVFEQQYTAEVAYTSLLKIYRRAIENRAMLTERNANDLLG